MANDKKNTTKSPILDTILDWLEWIFISPVKIFFRWISKLFEPISKSSKSLPAVKQAPQTKPGAQASDAHAVSSTSVITSAHTIKETLNLSDTPKAYPNGSSRQNDYHAALLKHKKAYKTGAKEPTEKEAKALTANIYKTRLALLQEQFGAQKTPAELLLSGTMQKINAVQAILNKIEDPNALKGARFLVNSHPISQGKGAEWQKNWKEAFEEDDHPEAVLEALHIEYERYETILLNLPARIKGQASSKNKP